MTPERWGRIKEVFQSALELDEAECSTFLDENCGSDDGLRRQVELLLEEHRTATKTRSPLAGQDLTGRTVSHYRILEKLGEGGMGVVYRAEDSSLHRRVALKFLRPDAVGNPELKTRLLNEAEAAAALDHPNICTVHEIDEAGGRTFIAMGYVEGETLAERIKNGFLPLEELLGIAVQAAEGLRAAHRKGIVHRDIKSANLMIDADGRLKIMDFGLAQLLGGDRITKTGTIMGTPAYMSPEQAQGLKTDHRTDIWSLGVVLYEMATGRTPFRADGEVALAHSIIYEPHQPLAALRPGAPAELDRIVNKALAKNPGARYQAVDEILQDLRAQQGQKPGMPATVRPPRRRRLPAALVVLALAAVSLIVWQVWRSPDASEPMRAVPLTTFPGSELYPSLSPDGNLVAFTWNGPKQDNADIYILQIGSASPPLRLTTDPSADFNPVWSPDGRWIAFLRGERLPFHSTPAGRSEVWLIPPLGGPERKITEIQVQIVSSPGFLAWCPDSACLVVTDSTAEGHPDALFVVSLESGEKRQLTYPAAPQFGDSNPAVSADGRVLVFRRNPAPMAAELRWLPLGEGLVAGGEPKSLTDRAMNAAFPAWIPGGNEILFSTGIASGNGLWRMTVSSGRMPVRLPFVGEDGWMPAVARPQPGRPARLVYVRSLLDSNIWRVTTPAPSAPASSPPAPAISSTRRDFLGDLSPDGRRIAFCTDRSGEVEIWLADPDGSNAVQLTDTGSAIAVAPRWSPDGRRIAFQSNVEGQIDVYVIPASGGTFRRITDHPASDNVPSFSRDGKWIYFSSTRTGDWEVWKAPVDGGDAVPVTSGGGFQAHEAMDGATLFYTQKPGGPTALWRMPTSGGPAVKLLDPFYGAFAVAGGGIYYIERHSGETRLQFFDFATEKTGTIASGLGEPALELMTASADGRTILYSRQDAISDDLMLVENFR